MKVYLGLGTNLGDKELNLRVALQKIEERIGKIISLSAFYATAPWGFQSENNFLNAAVGVETVLSPFGILESTQRIEQEIGRLHKSRDGVYSDRLIDIDLLLYGDKILQDERLIVPHPLMTDRKFVLEPLAEIAPDVVHPVFRTSLGTLVTTCRSTTETRTWTTTNTTT